MDYAKPADVVAAMIAASKLKLNLEPRDLLIRGALSGGRFVVAWTEENVDNPAAGTNVGARLCSAQGALGKPIQVNTVTGGSRFSLSVATTTNPSGELAFFAWNDDTKTSGDQFGHAVKGRILDAPTNGF